MSKPMSFDTYQPFIWVGTFISGIVAGLFIRSAMKSKTKRRIDDIGAMFSAAGQIALGNSYKMALCVRSDLKMSPGKIASQCAHAAVIGVVSSPNREIVNHWLASGQKKIVLKLDSLEQMHELESRAKSAGISTGIVHDAGKTQVAPMSETVLVIGPHNSSEMDAITGKLKLFS